MEWVITAFWLCLAVGAIYTVVTFIMGGIVDIGGAHGDFGHVGGDFSHDYGVGGDGGYGQAFGGQMDGGAMIFGPFSPMVIAFFLTCFGGTGLILTEVAKISPLMSVPFAVLSGVILAWLLILLFNRVIGSIQASSEVRLYTLVGTEAEVTVDVPAEGIGEIAYVAMGSRNVAPARSEDHVLIPRFAAVVISRIVGNMFYVRPQVEERLRNLTPDTDSAEATTVASSEGG